MWPSTFTWAAGQSPGQIREQLESEYVEAAVGSALYWTPVQFVYVTIAIIFTIIIAATIV
jgi:hypothetical protein